MAHIINYDNCTGCQTCYERCPENVYAILEDGRIHVQREEQCWLCGSCQMDCPTGALKVRYDINVAPLFFATGSGAASGA
jgi:NAD-dependent dihydropyrimidine dehydrogenase PreA subunit